MKQLSFILLCVLGLIFFIPIQYNFIFSAVYFIVNLALVWGFRMRGVIQNPVNNIHQTAAAIVFGPFLFLIASTIATYLHPDKRPFDIELMRAGLIFGVIVLQYVAIVFALKKPLFDRY